MQQADISAASEGNDHNGYHAKAASTKCLRQVFLLLTPLHAVKQAGPSKHHSSAGLPSTSRQHKCLRQVFLQLTITCMLVVNQALQPPAGQGTG